MLQCPLLKDRVFRSHKSIHTGASATIQRGTYKPWTEPQMSRALQSVVAEGVSVRRAALEYNVPKSSLADRVSGRIIPGAKSGPPTYLNHSEEGELVQFLTRCAAIGYGKSRKEVIAIVQRVLDSKGMHKTVSNGWWESFCRRHPHVSLRSSAPLSLVRAQASNPETLSRYFDLLERTLDENGLSGRPGQMFNMDESGMPLDPKSPKVVVERGSSAITIGSGNKSQMTIVGCVSAAGFVMPPMVIWDRKTLAPELTVGEVAGTIYGLSGNGWMDMELFHIWFSNHFLRYVPSVRPLLLLLDGHSSHYCPDTIRLAAHEKVILFTLPPNTTHMCQPLDRGCFGPLKMAWREECHYYMSEHPGKVVTKFQFSTLFNRAWTRSMTMANVAAGFRVTGIYPLNRHVLSFSTHVAERLSKETGLSFLPMHSPISRPPPNPVAHDLDEFTEGEFTEGEISLFETRFENGYDLMDDARYNQWLSHYHPEFKLQQLAYSSSAVSSFLSYPSPPTRGKTFQPKACGRVLTSSENLEIVKEKERKKEEKEEERERKKEERERKKEERERKKDEMERKKEERERKKKELEEAKRGTSMKNQSAQKKSRSVRKVSYQVVDVQESDLSFDCSDHDEQAYHGAEMEVPVQLRPPRHETGKTRASCARTSAVSADKSLCSPQLPTDKVLGAVGPRGKTLSTVQLRPPRHETGKTRASCARTSAVSADKSLCSPQLPTDKTTLSSNYTQHKLKPLGQRGVVSTQAACTKRQTPSTVLGPPPRERRKTRASSSVSKTVSLGNRCGDGVCSHPRAVNWVECGKCHNWYHCICVNLSARKAKTKDFICICCQ